MNSNIHLLLTFFLSILSPLSGTIIIYQDEGVSQFCIECLLSELTDYPVKLINANELIHTNWGKEASLFIMPGGRDLPYVAKLNGAGNAKIKQYVESGGIYLGLCAGAYYGSGYVDFDRNGSLEVLGERELQFFPGTAKGPAYGTGTYFYNSEKGAQVSWIELHTENGPIATRAYFNGGCYFEDVDRFPNTRVLAKFQKIEGNPPAIIECKVGKGIAILSGVHLEVGSHHLFTSLRKTLAPYEQIRQAAFQNLIPPHKGKETNMTPTSEAKLLGYLERHIMTKPFNQTTLIKRIAKEFQEMEKPDHTLTMKVIIVMNKMNQDTLKNDLAVAQSKKIQKKYAPNYIAAALDEYYYSTLKTKRVAKL